MSAKAINQPHVGTHLSISKGFATAGRDALEIGADTFSVFLRNPRGSRAKALNESDIGALQKLLRDNGFAPLVAHAPYTMNLANPAKEAREFSAGMLAEDLVRMEYLPGNYYNLHPGGYKSEAGGDNAALAGAIAHVADMLNRVLHLALSHI